MDIFAPSLYGMGGRNKSAAGLKLRALLRVKTRAPGRLWARKICATQKLDASNSCASALCKTPEISHFHHWHKACTARLDALCIGRYPCRLCTAT